MVNGFFEVIVLVQQRLLKDLQQLHLLCLRGRQEPHLREHIKIVLAPCKRLPSLQESLAMSNLSSLPLLSLVNNKTQEEAGEALCALLHVTQSMRHHKIWLRFTTC